MDSTSAGVCSFQIHAEPAEGEQMPQTVGLRYVGSEVAHARLMSVIWKSRGCKTKASVVRLGSEHRKILALEEHHLLCTTCVYLVSSQSRQDTFLLGKLQLEDVDDALSVKIIKQNIYSVSLNDQGYDCGL
jgi:hypothetical protein